MLKLNGGESLILGSSSPRRRELLAECGLPFGIERPELPEIVIPGEAPRDMVLRLAVQKAREVAGRHPRSWIIGADTTVIIDGMVLGKPADPAEAVSMLERTQGRWHEVWGGIALVNGERGVTLQECRITRVKMAAMSRDRIERYVATGEPLDKAGSYAIQGIGAHLVEEISGSYTNVVGLDVPVIVSMLERLGVLSHA